MEYIILKCILGHLESILQDTGIMFAGRGYSLSFDIVYNKTTTNSNTTQPNAM